MRQIEERVGAGRSLRSLLAHASSGWSQTSLLLAHASLGWSQTSLLLAHASLGWSQTSLLLAHASLGLKELYEKVGKQKVTKCVA